jgi:hypothetical protein
MADQSSTPVPPQTQQQFPNLVALILKSESMNDEERKYWINILPAMTPEQQTSLTEILTNERDQLAAIDAKYATKQNMQTVSIEETSRERKTKRDTLKSQEEKSEEEDTEKEGQVLKEIDTM